LFLYRLVTIAAVLWLVPAVVFLSPLEGALAAKKTTTKKAQSQAPVAQKTASKAGGSKKAPAPVAATNRKTASSARKTPVKGGGSTAAVASAKTGSKKAAPVKTAARISQRQPSQERYQEIQQALAEKGYYQGSVNGAWGPESAEALKKFQRDQKLTDDGKLSSKSIIALGLGPQRSVPAAGNQQ